MHRRGTLFAVPALVTMATAACTTSEPGIPLPASTPSTQRVFDEKAVEQGVRQILRDQYGETPTNVTCPRNQVVKVGTVFTCTLRVNGEPRKVRITVRSDQGEYEVSQSAPA
ncbi:DUF4333 domain-containing protein [Actinocrispum wychmicini]|uniref:Uncharacterized protein DUF4333 n=1 Tax=Actinocrispum wychmicini TaxID=1213861 RepID=A0A4R2JT71_9PSEU|nr:DUF4333 domain-containing protein [Actinocrispum wychmicini]TCO60446.1 uncharacterized protein DUF4333 [Actinocrispum wychmicini]